MSYEQALVRVIPTSQKKNISTTDRMVPVATWPDRNGGWKKICVPGTPFVEVPLYMNATRQDTMFLLLFVFRLLDLSHFPE